MSWMVSKTGLLMEKFVYNGKHYMVDALVSEDCDLSNPDAFVKCVEEIVINIDMTMILPPVTVKFPHAISELNRIVESLKREGLGGSDTAKSIVNDLKQREGEAYGYSTFVMIAESHLSIHTFPELNYVSFDCYSCKDFDHAEVERVMRKHFSITKYEAQLCARRVPSAD